MISICSERMIDSLYFDSKYLFHFWNAFIVFSIASYPEQKEYTTFSWICMSIVQKLEYINMN